MYLHPHFQMGDYVTELEFQIDPFPTFSLFERHEL